MAGKEKRVSRFFTQDLPGLSRLEKEDGHLPQIEVDEVLRFMGHIGAEVATHHCVPRRVVLLVKLLWVKKNS